MQQDKALAILKSGKNVFLTGSAGTGKTYVLNQYIDYLKARKVPVAITASTGIAATHMNGQTIHSWAGIGIKDSLSSHDLKKLSDKAYLVKKMNAIEVLILDEISMLHKRQLQMVSRVLQYFKGNYEAFGGVQVVLSGDFFQLPPVSKVEETNRSKFAFMSEAWLDAKLTICYLTEQYRQSDNELNEILNEIRSGAVSANSQELLYEARHNHLKDNVPTKLYSHNLDVDRINVEHLNSLAGDPFKFTAKIKGNLNMADMLKKSILTPEKLTLKLGAKVMFVKNNYEAGFMNGTLGEVIDFFDNEDPDIKVKIIPIVRTTTNNIIYVYPEKWSIDNESGTSLVSFIQVPLRLGWAITVHKSQGMTLDSAEIDLSKTFERGQGYVALSRLKGLDGLKLIDYNEIALQVDSLALKADKRFQELSEEADKANETEDLEAAFSKFILKCGGTINEATIRLNEDKIKRKRNRAKKKSTYEMTKEMIEDGKTLSEIAKTRGLTKNTIIGHLSKIKVQFPKTDISKFSPDDALLAKVEKAFRELYKTEQSNVYSETSGFKLKPLHQALMGEVSYDDLKLCSTFIEVN